MTHGPTNLTGIMGTGMMGDDDLVVRISVLAADGSAPRDAGTVMWVGKTDTDGTIGGGALEFAAMAEARAMLEKNSATARWQRMVKPYPLGPALNQCCGGYVHLLFERLSGADVAGLERAVNAAHTDGDAVVAVRPLKPGQPLTCVADRHDDEDGWPLPVRRAVRALLSGAAPLRPVLVGPADGNDSWYIEPLMAPATPLFLYGAGHVGRAVIQALAGLPFEVYWVDTDEARFPTSRPEGVHIHVAGDPAQIAAQAPAGAFHVVMTYSHSLDYGICETLLLRGGFGYLGLIGSKTKRARFAQRLGAAGVDVDNLARLHSPIGLPGLSGKEPAVIAVSLVADLLLRLRVCEQATTIPSSEDRRAEGGTP